MGEFYMNKWRKLIGSTILGLTLVLSAPAAVPLQGTVTEVQAAAVKPAAPEMLAVTSAGKNKITVRWQPVKGVTGYQIYRKQPGKQWERIKTLKGANGNTYTDTAVTTGKQYYYTVKAYKTSSGKTVTGSGDTRTFTTVAGLQYVKLNKTKTTVYTGKTTTLKLTGTTATPSWKSSNTNIATVSSKGVVTGKKAGTAKVTATLCGKKFTCTVTVKSSSGSTSLKSNYTKFKNYINKHGVTLKGTNTKYIAYKEGTTQIGVGYVPKTDKIDLFSVAASGNTAAGTDVLINCTKSKNGTAQISIFSKDGTVVLKATLCPSTYRKTTTLKFYNTKGKLITGQLAKASNDLVRETIDGANEVMKVTMKMTVRDIGFSVF